MSPHSLLHTCFLNLKSDIFLICAFKVNVVLLTNSRAPLHFYLLYSPYCLKTEPYLIID